MMPYPHTRLCEGDITVDSIKPLTERYLQLSKDESEAERRWHWVRSVEEDREIMAAIEAEQSTTEEKLAFLSWLALQEGRGYHVDCSKWGLFAGGWFWGCESEFQEWYIPILEEMEVSSEGDMWVEEIEQLRLTLTRPFGASVSANGKEYRNMTISMPCKLVKKDTNYWTAEGDKGVGKIYIPMNIIPRWLQEEARVKESLTLLADVYFMGFPACRGRKMPWRSVYIQ